MKPVLQNRWKIEDNKLVYYGLRKYPNTFNGIIKLRKKDITIIKKMDGHRNLKEFKLTDKIKLLIVDGIVVDISEFKQIPNSLEEAKYCKKCVANDFIIPGIEFDEKGICPLCRMEEKTTKNLSSVVPQMKEFEKSKKSRFDVALLYTGGKDSSYLLYYLAKVLNLRVLALTWEIPFLSQNAKKSIEEAKKRLPNVEFISRSVKADDLNKIYKKLLKLQNNTCMCPYLAYFLFYPLLINEKVPYIVAGNEPVQLKNLIFNQMVPLKTFKLVRSKLLNGLINVIRVVSLRKPYKAGQLQMIILLKQLVYGNSFIKKLSKYKNELIDNICEAIKEVPDIIPPLKKAVKYANRTGNIPTFVHIDLNEISFSGVYNWEEIKDILTKELGWVGVKAYDKGLHTSCIVEDGKDYSQFIRFRNMETRVIPFSALEISLAVSSGNVSKEKALEELKVTQSFSLSEPIGHKLMCNCNLPCNEINDIY